MAFPSRIEIMNAAKVEEPIVNRFDCRSPVAYRWGQHASRLSLLGNFTSFAAITWVTFSDPPHVWVVTVMVTVMGAVTGLFIASDRLWRRAVKVERAFRSAVSPSTSAEVVV